VSVSEVVKIDSAGTVEDSQACCVLRMLADQPQLVPALLHQSKHMAKDMMVGLMPVGNLVAPGKQLEEQMLGCHVEENE